MSFKNRPVGRKTPRHNNRAAPPAVTYKYDLETCTAAQLIEMDIPNRDGSARAELKLVAARRFPAVNIRDEFIHPERKALGPFKRFTPVIIDPNTCSKQEFDLMISKSLSRGFIADAMDWEASRNERFPDAEPMDWNPETCNERQLIDMTRGLEFHGMFDKAVLVAIKKRRFPEREVSWAEYGDK